MRHPPTPRRSRSSCWLLAAALIALQGPGCSCAIETPGEGEGEGAVSGEGEGEGSANGSDAPVVTIEAPDAGSTFAAGQSITFRCSASDVEDGAITDNTAFAWRASLDGDIGNGAQIVNALVQAGTQTITCIVVDSDGNAGEASIDVEITANDVPIVQIVTPADGDFFLATNTITFAASAQDAQNGNLATGLHWTIGTQDFNGAQVQTALALGDYHVVAEATDADGATGRDEIDIHVVSNLPPVCTITRPQAEDSFVVGTPVRFTATCTDPDNVGTPVDPTKMEWTSSNATQGFIGRGADFSQPLVAVGDQTISLCATDTTDATVKRCFAVPVHVRANTAPVTTVSSPTDGSTIEACTVIPLRCDATDVDNQTLSFRWLDGGTELSTNRNFNFTPTTAGAHTLTCEATDTLGLSAVSTVNVVVEGVSVRITGPADLSVFSPGSAVTFTGSVCTVDNSTPSLTWVSDHQTPGLLGNTAQVTVQNLAGGTHHVTLTATSGATIDSASVTVFVDSPPTVVIDAPVDNTLVDAAATTAFNATSSDPDNDPLVFDWFDAVIGSFGATEDTTQATMLPGKHVVTLTVSDPAGREASDTTTVYVTPGGQPFSSLFATTTLPIGVNLSSINDIAELSGTLFVGVTSSVGGLMSVTTSGQSPALIGTMGTAAGFQNQTLFGSVRDIAVAQGKLYVATEQGVGAGCVVSAATGIGGTDQLVCDAVLRQGNNNLQTNDTTGIAVLADGRLVIGTTQCMAFVDRANNRSASVCSNQGGGDRASTSSVRKLAHDTINDILYIAWTAQNQQQSPGASVLTPGADFSSTGAQVFADLTTNEGLPSNTVRNIAVGLSGDAWVGTSNGLARVHAGVVDVFRTAEGLPSSSINDVTIDTLTIAGSTHEVAWVATQAGIARVDAAVPGVVSITTTDGLPGNDVRFIGAVSTHSKLLGIAGGGGQQSITPTLYLGQ